MAHLSHVSWGGHPRPALFLLHGFAGSASDWRAVARDLESDFHCLAVDLPGHGATGVIDQQFFSMQQTAALVIQTLDRTGLDSTHLVGYSMGGRLALYLALHYPDRFLSLTLESASPGLETESERTARTESDSRLADLILTTSLEEFFCNWYRQDLFASIHDNPRLFDEMVARRSANKPEGLARSLKHLGTGVQPNLWPLLPKLSIHTLLMAGSDDPKYSQLARRMADLCPQSELSIIKQCGHNVHLERPREFCRVLRQFTKV